MNTIIAIGFIILLSCAETAYGLTVEQLLNAVLHDHPAVQVQQYQQESAESSLESANWQYFPTASASAQNKYTSKNDRSYSGDPVTATIAVQQPVWTGGRLNAGVRKAEAYLTSVQASTEETRQQLVLQVIQNYSDWLAANQKLQIYDDNRQIYLRLLDLVKHRIEQGASAESDLTLVMSRIESLEADTAMSRAKQNSALARLENLLGQHLEHAMLDESQLTAFKINENTQALSEMALVANPTIQKARAQALMYEAAIDERQADLSPEVYVRGEQQFGSLSYLNAGEDTRLFVGVSTRFGAWLSTLSNLDSAKAQYHAAIADIEAQTRTIQAQIMTDYAAIVASEIGIKALKNSQIAAEEIFASYDRQFLAGRRTWQDTLNAVRDVISIGTQLVDTHAAQILASWRLYIYTHGLGDVTKS